MPTPPKSLLFIGNLLLSQSQSDPIPAIRQNFFLKITSTHLSPRAWFNSWSSQSYHQVLNHYLLLDGKGNVTDEGQHSTPSAVSKDCVGHWKRHEISLGLSFSVCAHTALPIWKWFFPMASVTWHSLDSLNNSLSPPLRCIAHLLSGVLFLQMHFKTVLESLCTFSAWARAPTLTPSIATCMKRPPMRADQLLPLRGEPFQSEVVGH